MFQRSMIAGSAAATALLATGLVAGRLADLPSCAELVDAIVREARERLAALGARLATGLQRRLDKRAGAHRGRIRTEIQDTDRRDRCSIIRPSTRLDSDGWNELGRHRHQRPSRATRKCAAC